MLPSLALPTEEGRRNCEVTTTELGDQYAQQASRVMANAAIFALPRNRHLVAVVALLASSVGGFVPHQQAHARRHRYRDSNSRATATTTTASLSVTASITAVSEAAAAATTTTAAASLSAKTSSFLNNHPVSPENESGYYQPRRAWDGLEPPLRTERRYSCSSFEDARRGGGLGFFVAGVTSSAALWRSRSDGRRGDRRDKSIPSRKAGTTMALHFPKLPRLLNHFPNKSPKKADGKGEQAPTPGSAAKTNATSNSGNNNSSSDRNSTSAGQLAAITVVDDSSRSGDAATTMPLQFPKFPWVFHHFTKTSPKKTDGKGEQAPKPGGAAETNVTSNSSNNNSSSVSNSTSTHQLVAIAVADGAVKVPTPKKKVASAPAGHAEDATTKTDLSGEGKEVRKRPATGAGAPTSPTRKKRVRAAAATAATTSDGKPRKLVKRKRPAGSKGVRVGDGGAAALVAKDNMEREEMVELMKDILDRMSEHERELKKFRKEVSLAKPNRSEVRDRKFVIDTRAKVIGAAFAGSIAGMIVGWSVLPNLWLVGAVAGAVAFATLSRSSSGNVGSFCSTCGIQVALIYKDIRDWWEQTVFLYKTGKLSYTYWRGFEKYDQAWGLTTKYTETMSKLSKEALELDRQYKIRQKTLRAGKRVTKLSRRVGSSAAKEVTTFASNTKSWGTSQLRNVGLLREDPDDIPDDKKSKLLGGLLKIKRGKGAAGSGGSGGRKTRRPLGVSVVFEGVFGEKLSIYSAPPAGGSRRPGYRGDPVIPARIRHLFMTKKQIRDERLQKYRVGFMGMRRPRAFDKDD